MYITVGLASYAQNIAFESLWSTTFSSVGTFSSPVVADLNLDGYKDIVIGAGGTEFNKCDTAVIALDGKSGMILWVNPSRDQIFGTATIEDLNQDDTLDVIINGRSAELQCINGCTGEVKWDFYSANSAAKIINEGFYNFYNAQVVSDCNKDGVKDILVSNGGDVTKEAYDPNRAPGSLCLISGKSGELLGRYFMPDDKEIYMSIVLLSTKNAGEYVIFGTGGETLGGSLFIAKSTSLFSDSPEIVSLKTIENRGFIGPPSVGNLNNNNRKEFVVNGVDGTISAFDFQQEIWSFKANDVEVYTSPAIGNVVGKRNNEVVISLANGTWPNMSTAEIIVLDGITGEKISSKSAGLYQMSSPVLVNMNNDRYQEVLFVRNIMFEDQLRHELVIWNVVDDSEYILAAMDGGNLASTPRVADINKDGYFEIIWVHHTDTKEIYSFSGFSIHCYATHIKAKNNSEWPGYMGTNNRGY